MLQKDADYKYDKKIHGPAEVLAWRLAYRKLPEKAVSYETFRTWPDLFQMFYHLHKETSYHTKDYKTKMHTVSLNTSRDAKYENFYREFSLILNECDFIDEEGRKIFPIFDHELSEYQTRYFAFSGYENCAITNGRYTLFEGTFEECFNLMKREYWYE
jgi:hypothetical protein